REVRLFVRGLHIGSTGEVPGLADDQGDDPEGGLRAPPPTDIGSSRPTLPEQLSLGSLRHSNGLCCFRLPYPYQESEGGDAFSDGHGLSLAEGGSLRSCQALRPGGRGRKEGSSSTMPSALGCSGQGSYKVFPEFYFWNEREERPFCGLYSSRQSGVSGPARHENGRGIREFTATNMADLIPPSSTRGRVPGCGISNFHLGIRKGAFTQGLRRCQ
ncbi:hypothetical protein H1C71_031294, partial [Ictidomys tridecemlineatus]